MHIPFCVSKCPYCAFTSVAAQTIPEIAYMDALLKEIALLKEDLPLADYRVETIYIGGGTPSVLNPKALETLIDGIAGSLRLSSDAEISIELNPATTDRTGLRLLRRAGINRVVVGIQSTTQRGLGLLGRVHTVEDGIRAFEDSTEAGFQNIGIDLIYALPEQKVEDWVSELKTLLRLKPTHISTYELTIEGSTPFARLLKEGSLILPDEETTARMYEAGTELLQEEGYEHYEISNFALSGYRCRHNLKYWMSEDYIGLGVDAHSWIRGWRGGTRWQNIAHIEGYIDAIRRGRRPIGRVERLTAQKALTERLLMGLRLTDGIDIAPLKEEFGYIPEDTKHWQQLAEMGLVENRQGRLKIGTAGRLLTEELTLRLLSS